MTKTRQIRYLIFLRDVFLITVTGFGGPQAHLTLFIKQLVNKHNYLTEAELMELQSLCQLLPGPTSTQTITSIGFRLGGAKLAYLTLLVWALPATIIMTVAALGVSMIEPTKLLLIAQYIKPMGVAFIFYAAYSIGKKVLTTKTSYVLAILAAFAAYYFRSPYVTPIWILLGGLVTSLNYRNQEKMKKDPFKIEWANFILWAGFFIALALIGKITHLLPIRLFENFYRNGSLAFGGGHILKPLLYNEFVEFKHYLTRDEFLSGIALAESVPGPTFSIASYVGALSIRDNGISGQLIGSLVSTVGIFLPGTFLIFFVIRFWQQAKQYRGVRASLEGINAASTGLTLAAGISLFEPMLDVPNDMIIAFLTFLLLISEKIPTYFIILIGLFLGIISTYLV